MELSFNTYSREYCVALKGMLTHDVKLGTDIHGNITRLNNSLEGMADKLNNCKSSLADVHKQLESAKGEVGRPFPQEAEFQEKSARLKELNILLNMDQKDREILDAEPDEGDIEPPQRSPGWER
jgi:predicted RNase H-like nuclease (RuvC/YqgF family)